MKRKWMKPFLMAVLVCLSLTIIGVGGFLIAGCSKDEESSAKSSTYYWSATSDTVNSISINKNGGGTLTATLSYGGLSPSTTTSTSTLYSHYLTNFKSYKDGSVQTSYSALPILNTSNSQNVGSSSNGDTTYFSYPRMVTNFSGSRTGYTFNGIYTASSGGTQLVTSGGSFTDAAYTTTSTSWYVQWITAATATVTVNHYKQNLGASGTMTTSNCTLVSTTEQTGNVGSSLTATRKSYGGFNQPSSQTVTVPSGGTTVNYYYSRKTYTLTLTKGTGISTFTASGTGVSGSSVQYGASVSLSVTPSTGYDFSSYTVNSGGVTISNNSFTQSQSAVSITANGSIKTIAISLNKQSGSGGTSTVYYKYGTNTYYSDSSCSTTISSVTTPTRSGYTFGGYYSSTGGSGTQYITSSGEFTNSLYSAYSSNSTIYAKWTAKTITITLNNQSATSAGSTKVYYKYNTNKYYSNSGCTTEITTITNPSKTGYIFGGYYTSTEGGGTQYITNASGGGVFTNNLYSAFSSNTTLYAKWTGEVVTITLNKVNGSGGTTNYYHRYGESTTYSDSSCSTEITSVTIPTRSYHTFGGYYTAPNGMAINVISNEGVILTTPHSTTFSSTGTFYAYWIPIENACSYTVYHYKQNLGNWTAASSLSTSDCTLADTDSLSGTYGNSVTPSTKSYTGFTAPSGQSITISGSNTVYYYYARNSYTLTLTKGTGIASFTASGTGVSGSSAQYGATVSLSKTASNGYSFSSYTVNAGGVTISSNSFTQGTSAVTITANASANTITLTLNKNGGSGGTDGPLYYKYNTNTFYTNSACTTTISSVSVPSKNGYTFVKYYGDGTCGGNNNEQYISSSGGFASDLCYDIYKNATLYASWSANTITITLNKQDGSGGSDYVYYKYNTNTYYSNSDCTTTLSTVSAPSKSGYTFGGYYTSTGGGGTQYITSGGAYTNSLYSAVYASRTLYAKWSSTGYTVTLDGNGATTAGTTSVTAYYNSTTSFSITNPQKTGNTFAGWTTTQNGSTIVINTSGALVASIDGWTNSSSQWAYAGAKTVYAKWNPISYTVTAKANSGSISSTSGWSGTGTQATKSVSYGSTYGTLPSVSRSNYTLEGWHLGSVSGSTVTSSTTMSTASAHDIVAKWNAVARSITIKMYTYNVDGTYTEGSPILYSSVHQSVSLTYTSVSNGTASSGSATQSAASATYSVHQGTTFSWSLSTSYICCGLKTSLTQGSSSTTNVTSGSFTVPTSDTTYYLIFQQANVKAYYDSVNKYYYYEDGYFPQYYVGDSTNASLNSGTWGSQGTVNVGGVELPNYSGPGYSFVKIQATKNMTIKLRTSSTKDVSNTTTVVVTAGSYYCFGSSQSVRWRLSDYGVGEVYNVGDFIDNTFGISDIMGYGPLHSTNSVSAGFSSTSLSNVQIWRTSSYSDGSSVPPISSDKDTYNSTGNVTKVTTTSQTWAQYDSSNSKYALTVASLGDISHQINSNLSSHPVYASDLTAFLMGCSIDQATGWTRSLYNLGSAYALGPGGTKQTSWFTTQQGYIFVHPRSTTGVVFAGTKN